VDENRSDHAAKAVPCEVAAGCDVKESSIQHADDQRLKRRNEYGIAGEIRGQQISIW